MAPIFSFTPSLPTPKIDFPLNRRWTVVTAIFSPECTAVARVVHCVNPKGIRFSKHLIDQLLVRGYVNCWPKTFIQRALQQQQPDQGLAAANVQFHDGVGIVPLAKPGLHHFGLDVAGKSELLVTIEREEDVPRINNRSFIIIKQFIKFYGHL